ncbi:MAG: nickel-dependent lactate racemase [Acidobacteriota bacterium]
MSDITLAYGHDTVRFAFDEDRYQVLIPPARTETPLSDVEIGLALDSPMGTTKLEEILSPGESVLIVVSDATRATASAQIVNLLVRRVIQMGISMADIAIIFATGIHRPVTTSEKQELLTPFIFQRIRTIDHSASDAGGLLRLGITERGSPVEVNRALLDFSRVIVTGAVGFHYFAGFTGGRKSVCPGLASAPTIEATHMLALDFQRGGRRAGVGTGLLDGNAVNEECERIAGLINPAFTINTVVDERGRAVRVYAGHWRESHRAACVEYLAEHSATIGERRDVVIASCGGRPSDINLIQAHKTLDMAARACKRGGTIILLAECGEGLGRHDFLKWFTEQDSGALEKRLGHSYEVNGQTAWSLLTKAEQFRVVLVSQLDPEDVKLMRMEPASSLTEAMAAVASDAAGLILPRGAALLPLPAA